MINKINSAEYNKILYQCFEDIQNLNMSTFEIKKDMNEKINLINLQTDYLNLQIEKMLKSEKKNKQYIFLNNNFDGKYDNFGNVVHAMFKRSPFNIFNLPVSNTGGTFFRQDVSVKVNNIEKELYLNILKSQDVKDKGIFCENFENPELKITIESKTNTWNIDKFNIIEVNSLFDRSYSINRIKLYDSDMEKPYVEFGGFENIGTTRIILDKKYSFKKIEFEITLNYSTYELSKKIYPFGLNNILFYEAEMKDDSYIIAHYHSENYIDSIDNNIEIETPFGTEKTTLNEKNMKIYLNYENNILQNEHEPNTITKHPIPKNVKDIYIKIPIFLESLIGIQFHINER